METEFIKQMIHDNTAPTKAAQKQQAKQLLLTMIARYLIGSVLFETDDWIYINAENAARMTLDSDWSIARAQQYFDDTIAIESINDN